MPLIIKVASIPKERIQVYFIDNEEYFKRKATLQMKTEIYFLITMSVLFSLQKVLSKLSKN